MTPLIILGFWFLTGSFVAADYLRNRLKKCGKLTVENATNAFILVIFGWVTAFVWLLSWYDENKEKTLYERRAPVKQLQNPLHTEIENYQPEGWKEM